MAKKNAAFSDYLLQSLDNCPILARMNEIIALIESHAEATGLAPSTICQRAVQNSRLYLRLKAGGGCTIRTAERLRAYVERSRELA